MNVEWREELATGNQLIDDQHKELFKRFNNLLAACSKGKGKEEVNNLLLFLGDYVRSHFATEEELQIKYRYPGYQDHKAEHESFIRDLHKLENESQSSGTGVVLVIQANQMVSSWLIRHISGTDKKLAKFLHTVM